MWPRGLFIGALVCQASRSANGGSSAQDCYTFYAGDLRTGPSCPASCPYRTQCKSDTERFSCTQDGDCKYLLPRGDQVNMIWPSHANDSLRSSAEACVSCTINGCIDCKSGQNGLKCSKCNPSFALNSEGTCIWKSTAFDSVVYTGIAVVMILSVWLLIDLIRAECAPIKNRSALARGLKMRRRAQLFRLTDKTGRARSVGGGAYCSDSDGTERSQLQRYPLNTGLHWHDSHHIMGPGLPLFMNWFPFMILLGLWFVFGTLLYAPSYSEEETYVDPCKQQGRVKNGWVFRTDTPLRHGRDGNDVRWAIWNYAGATLITAIFLYLQQRIWSKMVEETSMPSLREYCVVLSGIPEHETNKEIIRRHLGNWMERLALNPSGIKGISIAYHIPADKREQVEDLIEQHLELHAHQQSSGINIELEEESSDGPPTKPPFYFWIRLLAWFIHKTPFWHAGAKVSPECHHRKASDASAIEMLQGLQGSGTVFVIMESEALARAVGSMGRLHMPELSRKPIRAMKPSDPTMIHWHEYGQVPWGLRLLRWVRVPIVLFISCNVWLMFFAGFLHFELMTTGVAGPTVGISGFFVGMLVPIGNALLGLIIDVLMRNSGFQDDDTIQLCRQVLNVAVNGAASIGEIYLVYKKVYNQSDWGISDFMMHVRDKMLPLGVNPSTLDFQHELKVILFPAGMLVPIVTIPLLADAMPFVIGRLRLKGDRTLTPADAERILRPNPVDLMPAYTDFIINLFIVTFASWFSPGTYLITLWLTFSLWVLLLYINMRMSVLRWQARSYIGGKKPHKVETFLIAIPLGFLCAALDHEREPADHSGLLGLACHIGGHFIFVNYILATLEPPKQAFGTLFEEMMGSELAPITNYHNTNPIEVLRRQYCLDGSKPSDQPIVFYRNDKWYLQQRFMQSATANPGWLRNSGELFAGENAHIGTHGTGIISAAKCDVMQLAQDLIQVGADTRRGAVQTVQTVRRHGSNRAGARTDSRAGSPHATLENEAVSVDRHAPSSNASSSQPVDAS